MGSYLFGILVFLLFLFILYLQYRIELNKFKGREGICAVIQEVEVIDIYDKHSKRYKITAMLPDSRYIVTEIVSESKYLGKGVYALIPYIGGKIVVYDNNDGTYDNDYKVTVRKTYFKKMCFVYIFGFVVYLFFTFLD